MKTSTSKHVLVDSSIIFAKCAYLAPFDPTVTLAKLPSQTPNLETPQDLVKGSHRNYIDPPFRI